MLPLKLKLTLQKGKTFRHTVRWESDVFAYAAISAISRGAPCRITTQGNHGLPDGWRVAVTSAGGMEEINASANPPVEADYRIATVVAANQIEFNDMDSSLFGAYTSGGYLRWRAPQDLTGFTGWMTIKDRIGGVVLLTLTTANGGISINASNKTIELFVSATDTAAFAWKGGVYDLELISPSLEVTALLSGSVTVLPEVTT